MTEVHFIPLFVISRAGFDSVLPMFRFPSCRIGFGVAHTSFFDFSFLANDYPQRRHRHVVRRNNCRRVMCRLVNEAVQKDENSRIVFPVIDLLGRLLIALLYCL